MVPARSTRRRLGERAPRNSSGGLNNDAIVIDVRVERLVLDADDAKEEEAFEVVRATATTKTTKTEDECDDDGILCGILCL